MQLVDNTEAQSIDDAADRASPTEYETLRMESKHWDQILGSLHALRDIQASTPGNARAVLATQDLVNRIMFAMKGE